MTSSFHGNGNIEANAFDELKKSAKDKHMTVLHVADVTMPNPKLYDQYENEPGASLSLSKKQKEDKKRKRDKNDDEENGAEPAPKRPRIESEGMTFAEKLYQIEKKTEEGKNKGQLKIPSADSLYTLLTQSLSSNVESYIFFLYFMYLFMRKLLVS